MARRPNYGFEKRQKELDRQKKKEAKAERKQVKRDENARGVADVPPAEAADGAGADAAAPGDHEHPHRPA